MLPITGYVDRWSVRPGEEINFMIGVRGGRRYRARIARVICGDPNPQGPGYREIPVSWALEGEHDGEEQLVAKGSWIDIPLLDPGTGERPIAFAATIWPTLITAGRQAVLSWRGGDAALASSACESPAANRSLRMLSPTMRRTSSDMRTMRHGVAF
jgi:N,N-dimethylformamidase